MLITADTVHKVFELVHKEAFFEDVLRKYFPSKKTRTEFKNELWLYFFESPEKTIEAFNKNYFKYLYLSIIKNWVISTSSTWHKKFRKNEHSLMEHIPEVEDETDLEIGDQRRLDPQTAKELKLRLINDALDYYLKLDPTLIADITWFKYHYMEKLSFDSIAERLNKGKPKKLNTCKKTVGNRIKYVEVLVKYYIRKKTNMSPNDFSNYL